MDIKSKENRVALYITICLFLSFVSWWLYVQYLRFTGNPNVDLNGQAFAAGYGIVALWGGGVALTVSKKWGFFSSLLGKSIFAFSVGLFLQEFGQLAYSFYIYFMKVDIPYPSVGDIGYFGSIFFYIYGVYLLHKLLSVSFTGATMLKKSFLLVGPAILLAVSYFLFLKDREAVPGFTLTTFLDFGYPFFQCIYVSLAFFCLVFLGPKFGGAMRSGVLMILIALISQYISDFTFLFKASKGTYMVGGLTDLLYLISYFLMALAIIELDRVFEHLKSGKISASSPISSSV